MSRTSRVVSDRDALRSTDALGSEPKRRRVTPGTNKPQESKEANVLDPYLVEPSKCVSIKAIEEGKENVVPVGNDRMHSGSLETPSLSSSVATNGLGSGTSACRTMPFPPFFESNLQETTAYESSDETDEDTDNEYFGDSLENDSDSLDLRLKRNAEPTSQLDQSPKSPIVPMNDDSPLSRSNIKGTNEQQDARYKSYSHKTRIVIKVAPDDTPTKAESNWADVDQDLLADADQDSSIDDPSENLQKHIEEVKEILLRKVMRSATNPPTDIKAVTKKGDREWLIRICKCILRQHPNDEAPPEIPSYFSLPNVNDRLTRLIVVCYQQYAEMFVLAFCLQYPSPVPGACNANDNDLNDIKVFVQGHYPSESQMDEVQAGGLFVTFESGANKGRFVSPTVDMFQAPAENMVKEGLLPKACMKRGGLLKGGGMAWNDALPIFGPSDCKGTHVPEDTKELFVSRSMDITFGLLKNLKKLKMVVLLGAEPRRLSAEYLIPRIKNKCPSLLSLFHDKFNHTSSWLFSRDVSLPDKSRNLYSLAKMYLVNADLVEYLPRVERLLAEDGYCVDRVMRNSVKDVKRGYQEFNRTNGHANQSKAGKATRTNGHANQSKAGKATIESLQEFNRTSGQKGSSKGARSSNIARLLKNLSLLRDFRRDSSRAASVCQGCGTCWTYGEGAHNVFCRYDPGDGERLQFGHKQKDCLGVVVLGPNLSLQALAPLSISDMSERHARCYLPTTKEQFNEALDIASSTTRNRILSLVREHPDTVTDALADRPHIRRAKAARRQALKDAGFAKDLADIVSL